LQVKKKTRDKISQNNLMHNLNINQQIELFNHDKKQKLKGERLESSMQRENVKNTPILNEI
jgi:hypothetical protein